MIDLTNAPPGIATYAKSIQNLTNFQVWEEVELGFKALIPGTVIEEYDYWRYLILVEELRRRLSTRMGWLDGAIQMLEPLKDDPACEKCSNADKKTIKTKYCRGGWKDEAASCFLRPDAEGEHMHRKCDACGYEWLEACREKSKLPDASGH
jgi:hypothetical protein